MKNMNNQIYNLNNRFHQTNQYQSKQLNNYKSNSNPDYNSYINNSSQNTSNNNQI